MSTSSPPAFAALQARLPELMLRDEHRLGRRLDGARRIRKPEARQAVLDEIAAEMEQAEARVARRRAGVPAVTYPEALPVSQKKDAILAAIRDHQVVIVAGETGSGKTTQIPKICLELGRGVRGLIGHTQPRRIAARTVAERVAEELNTPLGEAVGWKVRFTDQVSPATHVKLMTDGILLAEIQTDRELRQYDTIIIDEAHERSLNIDFILGYLAQLLPKRPDLKVVITSATIDPERFARHFRTPVPVPGGAAGTGDGDGDGDDRGAAPVVEVSGRTYPVEVRYRPLLEEGSEESDRDQVTAICEAVDELQAEGPGDILVFLSGEREIRDTADALGKRNLRSTEILPLYARLSHAEQHRVFQRHAGRRVVLATNVAETSLTVPGIRYVIDPGTARISRYSHRTKVQRLPIERISQASANQRKGRCGRTADGICIRLYSEDDFLSRPEFTDAEILRTNLASVILQMTAAGLGDIERFPFIDPPDRRNIKDGVQLLEELGAFSTGQKGAAGSARDAGKRLTQTGRKLSQLPVDPRLARMVLEADRNGCVREVMVIAAALSIQDPRERPAEKQQQADQQHARFRDETSDFLAFLNLWRYVRERQKELSSSAFRRMCRNEFLNYLRIREWQDIYTQLRQVARSMGIHTGAADETAAPADRVHTSLLAGLLSHIGLKDTEAKNEYLGARSAKFAVFPGSALFKKPPRWIMSAELVETSRLWARVNARIEPEWVEPLAQHLVKRNHSEPHWEQKQAAVMAYERVTLYGVPIVAQRKVNYGRIDPETSRELFIRHALVEGDWRTHHQFFHDNRKLLSEVEELEHRARRRDILVDDETLFDFYDQRLPDDVVSGAHFDSWWKKKRREEPELLDFEKSMLINERAEGISKDDYPDTWRQGKLKFRVTYQFEPGADADGVTVHVPLQVLNQVTPEGFDWQIPGLREELVTELIRSLPKPVRRNYVPAPNYAQRFLAAAVPGQEPLTAALGRELQRMVGVRIDPEDWDLTKVPDHLKITFRVVDERRRKVAEDKDIETLKLRLKPKTQAAITKAFDQSFEAPASGERPEGASAGPVQRTGLTSWTLGTLPRTFETRRAGQPVKAYPALVDEGESVAVRLFDTEWEQTEAMWRGTRRLILLGIPVNPAKFAQNQLSNQQKLALSRNPHGSVQALFDDCVTAAADRLIAARGGPAWDEESFRKLYDAVRADLVDATMDAVRKVREVLAAWHACEQRLRSTTSPALLTSVADVRQQLAGLIKPGFVTEHGVGRLPDLMRYLVAADRRLQQMPAHAERDRTRMAKVHEMQDEYAWLLEQFPPGRPVPPEARKIRWMIEELRVSYFAHALGTAYPVSDKRIVKAVDAAAPSAAR
ncbi:MULTISPECIES: ATP-dependent RNA helicase HrpA [Streptomyces]|uniref:RNA helicase n=2 Tax=Streptomyces TaxID=1883 RepID=A0A3R7HU75_9ACTN|nr:MULTISPECIES: ATP-dependent RNA helicase HrpA [Streptomyces]KNE82959.1 ATP-dependent helicase [Streptomyces fradiae]OFA52913.1 ATP-dependent RNA helicase HrpA [Streptomyces fradiae]PQM20369.1 ATP-dependent RNA helicase HrpA [Streptomyces xinghaiensis]RKM91179.1 ATP-dependent RNA helicase HrpA [Streptomyces xinghaiensis]RNC69672.1 ATP-dependent RNA helicase HrpA [Streptomyces xinghaiensis]